MSETENTAANLSAALQQYFGFSEFLHGQAEVVERILAGEELCVVMPTGAGKSLCYQLPILLRPGYGLVVSPLIALMKDQVDALQARGLPAVCVNSSMSPAEQSQVLQAVAAGQVKFLYVAPERFRVPAFQRLLGEFPPNLLVVDEAHCISQWGHDFRPDYQRIWGLYPELSGLQLCAFTATATPEVRRDIQEQLQRPEMNDVVSGFKRPNLCFSVLQCKRKVDKNSVLERLLTQPQPTLIYTSSRKEAEAISSLFSLRYYHAGLCTAARRSAQDYFSQSPCPVLVATNAFGMGIDRPDIRRVIHYNIPGSLEAYYQEAGRAGRDGAPADCLLLDSPGDRHIQNFLLGINNPPGELLLSLYRYLREQHLQGHREIHWDSKTQGAHFPQADSESHLQAALRILERHGIVERLYLRGVSGQLSFLQPLESLLAQHQGIQTQRSIFICCLAKVFLEKQVRWLPCGITELSAFCGLRPDQVEKVLEFLQGEVLLWQSTDNGIFLRLTEAGSTETLQMDMRLLKRKRELDEKRLSQVMAYCRTKKCRQAYIIGYFGEKIGSWRCGHCDFCAGLKGRGSRSVSQGETAQAKRILQALQLVDGEFGRRRFIGMLYGQEDSNMALQLHPYHGKLRNLSLPAIENLLAALEDQGYVQIGSGEYPCLELSRKGLDVLHERRTLIL